MLAPLTAANAQMRSAAGQLPVRICNGGAGAALHSNCWAVRQCRRQRTSAIGTNGRAKEPPTSWASTRPDSAVGFRPREYAGPLVTTNSRYIATSAEHRGRPVKDGPRAAEPEPPDEESGRRVVRTSRTVDTKETLFFDEHSPEWWDFDGPFAALHDYTPYRVQFLVNNLQSLPRYQQVLRQLAEREAAETSSEAGRVRPSRSAQDQPQSARRLQRTPPRSWVGEQGAAGYAYEGRAAGAAPGKDSVLQRPRGRLEGFTILDVGCGGGLLCEALAREGAAIVGIDAAREAIRIAEHRRLHGPYAPVVRDRQRYISGCLENGAAHPPQLPGSPTLDPRSPLVAAGAKCLLEGSSFDVVVVSEVLEHVKGGLPGVDMLLATVADNYLKRGGLLMLTTLNRTPENYLVAILAAEYVFKVVPQGTHAWKKFVKPEEILHICRRHGLHLLQQRGYTYIPFLRVFISEPFCRFLYMMAFEKL